MKEYAARSSTPTAAWFNAAAVRTSGSGTGRSQTANCRNGGKYRCFRPFRRETGIPAPGSCCYAARMDTGTIITIGVGVAILGVLRNMHRDMASMREGLARVEGAMELLAKALIEGRLRDARGIADANLSTDEIMRITRGEEDGNLVASPVQPTQM